MYRVLFLQKKFHFNVLGMCVDGDANCKFVVNVLCNYQCES